MWNIHTYFNLSSESDKASTIIESLVGTVEDSPVGFAGFIEKRFLQETLGWSVIDEDQQGDQLDISWVKEIVEEDIKQSAVRVLEKCEELLPLTEELYLHIFPTWSEFVKTEMDAVSGFTPYKNTILLFLAEGGIESEAFEETLAHEYLHAIHYNYHSPDTLGSALVFEGLALHFAEAITGKKSKFSSSLSEDQTDNLSQELKLYLDSTDLELQRQVFTRGDKYPLWGGYALGYRIVADFLKENKNISWQELIRLDFSDF